MHVLENTRAHHTAPIPRHCGTFSTPRPLRVINDRVRIIITRRAFMTRVNYQIFFPPLLLRRYGRGRRQRHILRCRRRIESTVVCKRYMYTHARTHVHTLWVA